jgi:hypothetical protein
MRHLAAFARFWYDFLVGDDWIIAVTVVVAVAVTALVADDFDLAWLVLPLASASILGVSVVRARRRS